MTGISKMNTSGTFKTHSHPYYQLCHILRGEFRFAIDGIDYDANVGDTVLIPMNSEHMITQTNEGVGYYFEVKFSTYTNKDRDMCNDIDILIPNDKFSRVLLEEIFDEKENLTSLSEDVMVTYLYAILYKLSVKSRRNKNTPSKYIELTPYSTLVRDTIRFLEDNYMKQLALEDIVKQTKVTKSYLCRRFKQETTLTIFECLMIIRVRKAVELLSYTDMSLDQISKATGFTNTTHFSKVFTKHVMIPPGQYRKHLRLQDTYFKEAILGSSTNSIAVAALEGKKLDFSKINNCTK